MDCTTPVGCEDQGSGENRLVSVDVIANTPANTTYSASKLRRKAATADGPPRVIAGPKRHLLSAARPIRAVKAPSFPSNSRPYGCPSAWRSGSRIDAMQIPDTAISGTHQVAKTVNEAVRAAAAAAFSR